MTQDLGTSARPTSARRIRVALVDDDAVVRQALATVLGQLDDIVVVSTAVNGADGVALVRSHEIDVFLMDVQMPVLDGVAATARILAETTGTRVLLLTTFDDDTFLDSGLAAGASGFLLKTTPPEEIASAIRAVHEGGKVISPSPASRVLDRYVHGRRTTSAVPEAIDLSARERDVLELLCRARSNRQIAKELHVAESTVKTHVTSIMHKMGVGTRLEIVVEAYKRGMAPDS